jgi:hypothetical protein
MVRSLAMVAGATAFVLCLVAIRDHAALVRAGYEVTALESSRNALEMQAAQSRERVNRVGSPAVLSRLADGLGLSREYPREFGVVRVRPVRIDGPVVVKKD